jgi:hypothetical protein
LEVNEVLWRLMEPNHRHSETAITLEHRIHALMEEVKNNGFPFDLDTAAKLEDELRAVVTEKEQGRDRALRLLVGAGQVEERRQGVPGRGHRR